MKLGLFALPAVFLLAVATVFVGCGSSDSLTLEEYFEQFEAIDADADAKIEALYADFPADGDDPTNDANLPFFQELFTGFPGVVGDLVDGLKDLDPPAEVEDAHNDLIEAGEDLVVALGENADAFNGAETTSELMALNDVAEESIQPAVARFDSACLAVVDIAEASGIANDISCEDDE